MILAAIMILGTSNAVNLTDGLDGLAAGSAIYGFIAFTVIAFWGFRHPEIYKIDHALDLAVVAVAMRGACAGFLWWNAAPARIFMGDTGSLAIGTGLAALAAHHQHAAAAADHRRALRRRDDVGDHAGDQLPPASARRVFAWRRSTTTSS